MSGRSTVSHYETVAPRKVVDAYIGKRAKSIKMKGQNALVIADPGEIELLNDEDVPDRFRLLAEGSALQSRLAWHDTLRNVRVFNDIEAHEPITMLDIGCGISHPLGRFIKERELDTTYIGMDPVHARAADVAKEKATRPFIGIQHDARNGIPLEDSTVDFVCCLAAVTQWVHSEADFVRFLYEVTRISTPGAPFWLSTPNVGPGGVIQHPHCHEFEFFNDDLLSIASECGFKLDWHANYRARPSVVRSIPVAPDLMEGLMGLPEALADAIILMAGTSRDNKVVPGNVLYRFRTPR